MAATARRAEFFQQSRQPLFLWLRLTRALPWPIMPIMGNRGPYQVNQIAYRAGTSVRRLRYVVDHRLVRGAEGEPGSGRGVARRFFWRDAQALALAARLMDAGVRREFARDVVEVVFADPPYADLDAGEGDGRLQFADGTHVRLRRRRGSQVRGWYRLAELRGRELVPEEHRPIVVLELNVRELVRRLEG